jgi:hypothetical protein
MSANDDTSVRKDRDHLAGVRDEALDFVASWLSTQPGIDGELMRTLLYVSNEAQPLDFAPDMQPIVARLAVAGLAEIFVRKAENFEHQRRVIAEAN